MILVHAGNRVDAADSGAPRFPEVQVEAVAERLKRFLAVLRPRAVVTAAAAGADLILLEQALDLGIRAHVVLPFPVDRFRYASVADRGDAWLRRFDRVLAAVDSTAGSSLVELSEAEGSAAYLHGNVKLVEYAIDAAGTEGVLGLAVRPAPGPEESVTDDFVRVARQHGLTVIDIDPSRRLADRPSAFVVMPFGQKDFAGRKVDCDQTYRKLLVPLLEDADLAWERADQQLDTGIIHVGMIERLGNADVVVVDTLGANANVYYELGMRHALADRVTLLLGPHDTSPPFDTRPVRHFAYRLAGEALEDAAALDALSALQPVLASALAQKGLDSPLYYFFDRTREPLRGRDQQQPRDLLDLQARVTDARGPRDGEALSALVVEIKASPLPEADRRQLLLRTAIGLREAQQYRQSLAVLRELEFAVTDGSYALWVQQLAFALRRTAEQTEEEGGDPEAQLHEALQLLHQLLRLTGPDAESCGIAGGLAKHRARRALKAGARATGVAQLREAARLYTEGATAAPSDFYTTLNAATTLRVLAHHLDGEDAHEKGARRLLPVAEYFAERAVDVDPTDFWALVSMAECVLTRHFLDGAPGVSEVVDAYARASVAAPYPDALRSVRNQLQLYELVGDPKDVLARVQDVLG